MISGRGAVVRGLGGAQDGVDLHLVDLGVEDPQPHAAGAEHRVLLGDVVDAVEQPLELGEVVGVLDARALDRGGEILGVGEELVQRGVEQPDRDREPGHRA